jgi:hypothetical protein
MASYESGENLAPAGAFVVTSGTQGGHMPHRKETARAPAKDRHLDDPRFMQRNWRFQRTGWVVITLLLLLAVGGLLGRGPLSARHAGSAGGLEVSYHRVVRMEAEEQLDFLLPESAGPATLFISQGFLSRVRIDHISPEPERVEVRPDGQQLHFQRGAAGALPVRIVFYPKKPGSLAAGFAEAGAPVVPITMMVLP